MSTRIFLPGTRGRWVRRGGSIVLLPDGVGPGGGVEGEVGGRPPPLLPAAYTVCDFIDPRIDVAAQYALFGLLSGPGRAVALSMLAAVKAGALGGIFQEDQQAPALRARSLGTNWWTLIPKGAGAFCAPGTPPLISFRKSLANNRAALGAALLAVFPSCGVPLLPAPPPSGRDCTRPAPKTSVTVDCGFVVSPREFPMSATVGQGPINAAIDITPTAPGEQRWTAYAKGSWITLGASSGTVLPPGRQLPFRVESQRLTPGTHIASVVIENAGCSRVVDVELKVTR